LLTPTLYTFPLHDALPIYTILVSNSFGSATSDPARLQVVTPFTITNLSHNVLGCSFSLRTTAGAVYSVEYKDNLNDTEWQLLTTDRKSTRLNSSHGSISYA